MDSAEALSIEFLKAHPGGAIPVLETMPTEDAAAFFKDVPDDVGGKAFEDMQPLSAAAILTKLPRRKAAGLLMAMEALDRSRILRLLDDALVESLMRQLPKGAARDLTRFLQFPEGSVGAWMSAEVAVFEKVATVGECLRQLRALPERVSNLVFVVDDGKKLIGAVELADILTASDETGIGNIANKAIKRLSPYARLSAVVNLPAWDAALSLPVVDNKERLLGAMHFDRLREGLATEQRTASEARGGQIIFHLAEAFLVCAAGMLQEPKTDNPLTRPLGLPED